MNIGLLQRAGLPLLKWLFMGRQPLVGAQDGLSQRQHCWPFLFQMFEISGRWLISYNLSRKLVLFIHTQIHNRNVYRTIMKFKTKWSEYLVGKAYSWYCRTYSYFVMWKHKQVARIRYLKCNWRRSHEPKFTGAMDTLASLRRPLDPWRGKRAQMSPPTWTQFLRFVALIWRLWDLEFPPSLNVSWLEIH